MCLWDCTRQILGARVLEIECIAAPQLDSWNLHKGGGEDQLYSCPSASTCTVSQRPCHTDHIHVLYYNIPITQITYTSNK